MTKTANDLRSVLIPAMRKIAVEALTEALGNLPFDEAVWSAFDDTIEEQYAPRSCFLTFSGGGAELVASLGNSARLEFPAKIEILTFDDDARDQIVGIDAMIADLQVARSELTAILGGDV